MKKYVEMEMNFIALLAQDIVTVSGFGGEDDMFTNPNESTDPTNVAGDF